ncbi:MAG: recombinase RecA [Candidatus Paceibacterota bacterium]
MVQVKKSNKKIEETEPEIQVQPIDKSNFSIATFASKLIGKYGAGIVTHKSVGLIHPVDVIPTGSLKLDRAVGIGGLPRGRVVEVFGQESGGKTTLVLGAIAQAQKHGGNAAFIDAENALDLSMARGIGVDTDNLLVAQPDYGEQGLEITEDLVATGCFEIVAIDSVAALVPRAELEGDYDDANMGLQARMIGKGLRRISKVVSKTNTCVVFINQLRQKLGLVFGSNEVTPGGNALKFWSSLRLDVRKISSIKSGENVIGNKVKITVIKNKLAPPFKVVETDLIFGKGFSYESELFDMALEAGIVEKSGSWFSCGGERLGLGKAASLETILKSENMKNTIIEKIERLSHEKKEEENGTDQDKETVQSDVL